MPRVVAHVDMDAFYAQVEQRDDPQLKGKPVIVGGSRMRGVVSTCSYEARAYGVHSAMPISQARRLCPDAIFLSGRMGYYQVISQEILKVLYSFTPQVEAASIDEAYLELTGATHFFPSLKALGREIQSRIWQQVQLTASVGIGPNKFLAKLASDWEKPKGLTIIGQEQVPKFLAHLPVEKLLGVGPKGKAKLNRYGFTTVGQLAEVPPQKLISLFGKQGADLAQLSRGYDPRPVEGAREPKSMGKEETFSQDLTHQELKPVLARLAAEVGARLRAKSFLAGTITLKARYEDFETVTRSQTLLAPTQDDDLIFETAAELLQGLPLERKYRLVGVTASKLTSSGQLSLFTKPKQQELLGTLDELRNRYGQQAIFKGREMGEKQECD